MKNYSIAAIFTMALFLAVPNLEAQNFKGLDKSPMDAASYPSDYQNADKKVKIYYSRPQLKGRAMNSLAKNGEVWRTGANESSEIIFYEDMKMGDTTIKAGTYSLYTIPGDKEWTIILNSDLNRWGSYSYDKNSDVARMTVPVTQGDKSLEEFSIAFDDNGVMHMGWDKARVAVPFTK